MNDLLIKIAIGFTYKILWYGRSIFVQCSVCDVNVMTGFLTANCASLPIQDVPQDIDPKIEFLILSNNTFIRLNEKSFVRYQNLILLSLESTSYVDPVDPINYYTFHSLKNLEILILNEIHTPFNFTFYWPSNLRLISVNYNTYISDMDFSVLKKLQDVHARTHNVRTFPKFHRHSPLTFLDFRGNPMDSLTAEDLAPFCTLDYLSLEWPGHAVINGSERYCQCARLEKWIRMNSIGVDGPLNCTPPKDGDAEQCNLKYSENTLQSRRECINRINRPTLSAWFWIGLGVVLFAPLIIVTFKETKTHKRFSDRPTTITRNPKYANVKLKINVDEDFEDEDELEVVESEQENYEENEGKVLPKMKTSPKIFTKKLSPKLKERVEENITTPTRKTDERFHTTEKSPDSSSADDVSPDITSPGDPSRSGDISPDISSPGNPSRTGNISLDIPSPGDLSKKNDLNKDISDRSSLKENYYERNLPPDLSSPIDSWKEKESKEEINQPSPLKEEDSGRNISLDASSPDYKSAKLHTKEEMEKRSPLRESFSQRKESSEQVASKSPELENQSPEQKEVDSIISLPVNASRKMDVVEEPKSHTKEEYGRTKYRSPLRSRYYSPKRYRSVETSPLQKIPIKSDLMEERKDQSVCKEFKTPPKKSSMGTMYENPISPECYSLREYKSLEDMNIHHKKTDDQLSISSHSQEEIERIRKMNKPSYERHEYRSRSP